MKGANSHILFMKAGPYCGYSIEEIIRIKENEQRVCGRFYWGYGGVFCHPKRVQPFVQNAIRHGAPPKLLLSLTPSKFHSTRARATQFSTDRTSWEILPRDVILVGNQYAVTGVDLKAVEWFLDLSEYRSVLGDVIGPPLDAYIRHRVDKTCAVYDPQAVAKGKHVLVSYEATLAPPYCVYVR